MRSRFSIENQLRMAVELATRRMRLANVEFQKIMDDVPSGLPAPDGTLRIRKAAAEKSEAMKCLQRSLERLNGFVLDGKIPEDLAPQSQQPAKWPLN